MQIPMKASQTENTKNIMSIRKGVTILRMLVRHSEKRKGDETQTAPSPMHFSIRLTVCPGIREAALCNP